MKRNIKEKVEKSSGIKPFKHFLVKSLEVHGDKYDYSKVKYEGTQAFVDIVCPKHEVFKQKASMHMIGYGCPQCGVEKASESRKDNLEKFIEKAINTHGDFYDYSEVEYQNSKTKVKIICADHGAFLQAPNRHIQGQGCRKCSTERNSKKYCKTTEHFVANAKSRHGERYDYSQVVYSTLLHPVVIRCREHKKFFEQTPASHLNNREGCPICLSQKTEGFISKIYKGDEESNLYVVSLESPSGGERFFKVGVSVNPEARWGQISKETGYIITAVAVFSGPARDLFKCEQLALATHKSLSYKPEIGFHGKTECIKFNCLTEVLSFIRETLSKKNTNFKEKNYESE